MDSNEIIILVVVLVVIAAIVAALVMSRRAKAKREATAHADELRQQAQQGVSSTLPEQQVEAKRAEADAEEARLMAARADERAREARTGVVQQEAQHEHTLREADQIDPRVDSSADDYRPPTATTSATTSTEQTSVDDTDTTRVTSDDDTDGTIQGSHRA